MLDFCHISIFSLSTGWRSSTRADSR